MRFLYFLHANRDTVPPCCIPVLAMRDRRASTRATLEGCYLANGDVHFTAPRTNQILIEALMRGHSGRRGGRAMEGRRVRTTEEEDGVGHLVRIILCGFVPVHSDGYSSHVPTWPEQQLLLLPAHDFCNFVRPLHDPDRPPRARRHPSPSPRVRPQTRRRSPGPWNVHNYEHVTRLISCLNSPLRLDRPISSFDGGPTPIDARSTRYAFHPSRPCPRSASFFPADAVDSRKKRDRSNDKSRSVRC